MVTMFLWCVSSHDDVIFPCFLVLEIELEDRAGQRPPVQ